MEHNGHSTAGSPVGRRFIRWGQRVARWLLAGIFVYSGGVKLADPANFAVVVKGFGLLPDFLVHPAAIVLPILEILVAVGVALAVRGSLAAMAGMLLLFMAVLAYGIHLGLDVDCGCFGPGDPEQAYKSLRVALGRDAVMLAILLFIRWGSVVSEDGRPACNHISNTRRTR